MTLHPALKTLFVCIAIGLAFGSYLYFNYDHRPIRIAISLVSSLTIGSLMMSAIYLRSVFTSLSTLQSVKMIIMIILLLLAALIGSELTFLVVSFLSAQTYHPFEGGSIYILNILVVLVTGIPIYVSDESQNQLSSKVLKQQYRLLQLEQQKTVFELELLRAKINPHFLYNVHNTIAGLISKDPEKAEKLVMLLSRFFRFSLSKDSATFHTLNDELQIIETYLQMQQIRFGKRMAYHLDAETKLLNLQFPSFILQPLVENAIKHGFEKSTAPGSILVRIKQDQGRLIIQVADTGPDFPLTPGEGSGLQMVMNKLKLLYGGDFTFELHNNPEKYVQLTVPGRD